jgi:transcriptional regulator with XRE-family HTH domain
MTFSMKLKRLRRKRGMTQEALARKAGLSLGFIARLEIGRHEAGRLQLKTLRRLSKALGVPVTGLLG